MGSSLVVVLVIVAVAAGLREAKQRREQRLTRQALRGATAIDAAETEGGVVRVTGRIRIGTHCFDAPLSNRKCAAYRIRIYGPGGALGDRELRYEEMQIVPFEIERPDGSRVAIDSKHARLDMPHLPLPPGSEARCSELLTARRLHYKRISKLDFEETVIMDDMRLSVAGLLMKDVALDPDAKERGFRDGQAPAMRLAGDAKHPIIVGVPVD